MVLNLVTTAVCTHCIHRSVHVPYMDRELAAGLLYLWLILYYKNVQKWVNNGTTNKLDVYINTGKDDIIIKLFSLKPKIYRVLIQIIQKSPSRSQIQSAWRA